MFFGWFLYFAAMASVMAVSASYWLRRFRVTYPGEAMVPKEGASIREKDIMTGRSGAAGSGYD
jgi:hypothetical protein